MRYTSILLLIVSYLFFGLVFANPETKPHISVNDNGCLTLDGETLWIYTPSIFDSQPHYLEPFTPRVLSEEVYSDSEKAFLNNWEKAIVLISPNSSEHFTIDRDKPELLSVLLEVSSLVNNNPKHQLFYGYDIVFSPSDLNTLTEEQKQRLIEDELVPEDFEFDEPVPFRWWWGLYKYKNNNNINTPISITSDIFVCANASQSELPRPNLEVLLDAGGPIGTGFSNGP